jgi:hypothetical protein
MFGAAIPGAAQTYPYDGRHDRDGKRVWADGFYQKREIDIWRLSKSPQPVFEDRIQHLLI